MTTRKKSPSPDDDADRRAILDGMRRIVRALRLGARESEARVGLSAAQLFVLHKLADGRVYSLGELAQLTLTDPSSVCVVVARLAERGFVSRVRAPDDARRLQIGITSDGRALLRRAPGVAQEGLIEVLDALTPRQRRDLARLLGRVSSAMGLGDEPAPLFFENETDVPKRTGAFRHATRSR